MLKGDLCCWPGASSSPLLPAASAGGPGKGSGSTCSVAAEWQCGCHLLPAATAFRPSPGCPPPPPSPPTLIKASGRMGLEEAGTGGGQDPEARSLSAEGPGVLPLLHSLTQTPCPGQWALSKCSEIQRTCCCVPGSRRGGVLLCSLF